MTLKLDLSDHETRAALMSHVQSHGTFEQFAQLYGMDRKTISRQLRQDPEFKRGLDVARARAKCELECAPSDIVAIRASMSQSSPIEQPAEAGAPPAQSPQDGVLPGLPDIVTWRMWLWRTARETGAPPTLRSKCTDIIAQIIEAPELYRRRLEAEAQAEAPRPSGEAPGAGMVILELPSKATDGEVVDAELVE